MDLKVIGDNFVFIVVQGLLGFGNFTGGTLRLALPAILFGFMLGTVIGLGRLSSRRWINLPAT
ncbi:MAG: hypothetical protein ACREP5_00390, partial [Candidatus Binatia bacterium]